MRTQCPGCSGEPTEVEGNVFTCGSCGGVFTERQNPMTREETRKFVDMSRWCSCDPCDVQPEDQRYFDFDVVQGDGSVDRSHGWFHPGCKGVTQTG